MLSGNQVTTKYKTLRLKGLFPLGLSTLRINYTSFLLEMPLTKSFCQRERKQRTERYFKKILRFFFAFCWYDKDHGWHAFNWMLNTVLIQFISSELPLDNTLTGIGF